MKVKRMENEPNKVKTEDLSQDISSTESLKSDSKTDQKKSVLWLKRPKSVWLMITGLLVLALLIGVILFIVKERSAQPKATPAATSQEGGSVEQKPELQEARINCPDDYEIKDGDKCSQTREYPAKVVKACTGGSVEIGSEEFCGNFLGLTELRERCPDETIFEIKEAGELLCYLGSLPEHECGQKPDFYPYTTGGGQKRCYAGRVEAEKFEYCAAPDSYLFANKCFSKVKKASFYNCESGDTKKDDRTCLSIDNADPIWTCPDKYEYHNDGKCHLLYDNN